MSACLSMQSCLGVGRLFIVSCSFVILFEELPGWSWKKSFSLKENPTMFSNWGLNPFPVCYHNDRNDHCYLYLPSCPVHQPNYCFLMHLEVKHSTNSKILTCLNFTLWTLLISLGKKCSKSPGHDSAPEQRQRQLLQEVGARGELAFSYFTSGFSPWSPILGS